MASFSTHAIAIKKDGTCVAFGNNTYGQCNVSSWRNIIMVSCGASHTVGLKSDGTLIAVGDNTYGQCNVTSVKGASLVACGQRCTVYVKDGKPYVIGKAFSTAISFSGWTDIVDISAGTDHFIGCDSKGKAYATGNNNNKQCDISAWTNIIRVFAGDYNSASITSKDTLLEVGYKNYSLSGLNGNKYRYIAYGSDMIVLSNNNHSGAYGGSEHNSAKTKYLNIKTIKQVTASSYMIFILKTDGTMAFIDNSTNGCPYDMSKITTITNVVKLNDIRLSNKYALHFNEKYYSLDSSTQVTNINSFNNSSDSVKLVNDSKIIYAEES